NRRGFNRIHICRGCGKSITCPNCDVTLTYHLKDDRLACHYCGFQCKPASRCPSCGGTALKAYGFGTEKLENEIKILFPKAKTARIDGDIARKKGAIDQVLKDFGRQKTDILVGTQMITKGYDFPHVTLVGIISADLSLGFPDFRAGERTFHLISQVAGRAGRGELKGKVIIQTHNPDHYVIQAALEHDFQAFYESEKTLRKQLRYPPFSHLACLRVKGNNREKTEEAVLRLRQKTDTVLKKWSRRGKEIRVMGPVESPIAKIKGKYRWQFLFKCGSSKLLRLLLLEVERLCANDCRSRGVSLLIDVDPYHML
ncbi:MAG: primosomal protein N', partial [Deltaproteobacteria bacterium]|nr:primosomal protein N' [Deltaproteobacteria bacterium]